MISVKHETCQQYFRRRIAEGWKCISLEGYSAVLLSPEGIRRELDFRNDIETLRPNAPGDETNLTIGGSSPAATNWESVDEVVADDGVTYVYGNQPVDYERDLYNLPAHSASGTINKITVYARCVSLGPAVQAALKIACKTGGTAYEGSEELITDSWANYSKEWVNNPGGGAWTWEQIDALQVGVALRSAFPPVLTLCTQVYVEVTHSWTGKIAGVTNPAKVMGVEVVNIEKVKGVASA